MYISHQYLIENYDCLIVKCNLVLGSPIRCHMQLYLYRRTTESVLKKAKRVGNYLDDPISNCGLNELACFVMFIRVRKVLLHDYFFRLFTRLAGR